MQDIPTHIKLQHLNHTNLSNCSIEAAIQSNIIVASEPYQLIQLQHSTHTNLSNCNIQAIYKPCQLIQVQYPSHANSSRCSIESIYNPCQLIQLQHPSHVNLSNCNIEATVVQAIQTYRTAASMSYQMGNGKPTKKVDRSVITWHLKSHHPASESLSFNVEHLRDS